MISVRHVVRSALTRFFPTSLFLMAVGLAPIMLSGVAIHPWAPLIAFSQVVGGTLGFGAALLLIRRRLSADAPLLGRPVIVAGVVAPIVNMLALMVVGSPHTSRVGGMAACALGGGILALSMFFPWLSSATGMSDLFNARERDALPAPPLDAWATAPTRASDAVRMFE